MCDCVMEIECDLAPENVVIDEVVRDIVCRVLFLLTLYAGTLRKTTVLSPCRPEVVLKDEEDVE